MIYKRIKCKVVYVLVLAMILQIVGLTMSSYTHAETDTIVDKNLISLSGEISELDMAEDTEQQTSEEETSDDETADDEIIEDETTDGDDEDLNQEGENPEEVPKEDDLEDSTEKIEEPAIDEEVQQQIFSIDEAVEPKDLGNIFRFKTLKLGDKENGTEIEGNSIIDIFDGTKVYLEYDWDTEGLVVNPGDWAEIEVPNAFKHGVDFENEDIKLSDGTVVGKYSLIDGVIRFEFDEGINQAHGVMNGFVGFGLNFNLEVFKEDIVQEIEFNDISKKTITVIANPSKEITSIDKEGIPDADKDAKEITWTIDVINIEEATINDATLKDNIPEGLKLKDGSIKVYDLSVKHNGDKNQGNAISASPNVSGNSFEINFDSINPYKGYRIEYITTIEDYSKTSFTNDAILSHDGKSLPAKATVSGLTRSDFIEKGGGYSGNDVIEWTIDINKAGGRIGQAIVEEDLPAGLTIVDDSIKVYKLIKNGNNWSETLYETKTYSDFPIDLGELGPEDAYRIRFKTNIDYSEINSGNYKKEDNVFINKVILKDGDKEIGDAEKEVRITRDPILRKEGKSNVNYENKTLTWTVHVNEANHPITGDAVITDILPKGLSIEEDNINVYDIQGNEVTLPDGAIRLTPQGYKTEATINLGEIGKDYRKIIYTTEIVDFSINSFPNNISLEGTGVGEGGTVAPVPVNPPSNTYVKDHVGIDYNEKTMNWKITIKPTREPIKELKIIDTFPNKGLILLPETLVVKLGGNVLEEDIDKDYTLRARSEDGVEGYQKGFVLEFNIDEENPLSNEIVITYTTSYDPEEGIDANTNKDKWYVNKAEFIGKTKSGIEINISDDAKKQVIDSSWNSGKKEGKLISIDDEGNIDNGWISGNTRKIQWEVYINYLKQNLGNEVTVRDKLDYDGKIDEDSIVVRRYTVAPGGGTTIDFDNNINKSLLRHMELLDTEKYTIKMDEDLKGFTLVFNEEVKERYVIIFTTSVPEISEGVYTNNAAANVGEKEYPYTGTVSFDKHDDFLSKEALVNGDKVYTDQELNWSIKINESLSIIKDAKIEDTISKGLVYKNDSLKVYRLEGTNRVELGEDKDYTLAVDTSGEETVLTIEFNNTIDSTYEIEYTTVVTADKGQVNNKVEFSGTWIETKTVETRKLNAEQFRYIGGDPTKGKIRLVKVDEEGNIITSSKAKFILWYEINGEDYQFGNQVFETTDGELEIVNLPLNRTYYLEEIEAPQGYVLSDERMEIEVTKAAGNDNAGIYLLEVENTRIKGNIEFIKTDESNKPLPGAVFVLYQSNKKIKEAASDENGRVLFEDIEYGSYTIKEISAPEGYLITNEVLNVSIGNDDNNKTVKPDKEVLENKVIKGNIEFKKVDESNRALSGATFGLYDSSGEKLAEAASDENGIIRFENIPYGDYQIKEISAPIGYIESNVVLDVSIVKDGGTVYPSEEPIKNKKIIGDIEVKKLDKEDGTPLSGAIFVLEQNGEVKYTSEETDDYGRYVFNDIEYGKYTLKEIQPPEGYNPTDQSFEVEVKENGSLQSFEFENTKIRGSIKFKKLDEDRNGLQGAEFTIYKSNDSSFANPITTAVSDKDGNVVFENIEYGEYRIKETKAPKGYNLSDKILNAEITTEGEVFIPLEYEVSNTKIRGNIEILKRNRNTHNPLSDAKIAIYTEDDVLIEEKTTGSDGKVVFENLEYGRYYFKEIKAPSGYRLDNTKYYFDIEENDVTLMRNLDNIRRNRPTDPDPKDPKEPEKPVDPVDPIEPEVPVNPTQPEQPITSTNTENPEVVTPTENNTDEFEEVETDTPAGGTRVLPKTGEGSNILFYILGLLLIVIGLYYRKRTV